MTLGPVMLVMTVLAFLVAAPAAAQVGAAPERQGRANRPGLQGRGAGPEGGVTPAELQRMFDAYALVQAQDQLGLAEEPYARFLVRYRALQDLRRRSLQEHTRLVNELRRLLQDPQADGERIGERLSALADHDGRAAEDIGRAVAAIDEMLDIRQRAAFRVFEEQMERRKLELLTRARAGRAQAQ